MKYLAEFKNGAGNVIRETTKLYTFGWAVYATSGEVLKVGFAYDGGRAYLAAAAFERKIMRNRMGVTPNGYEVVKLSEVVS